MELEIKADAVVSWTEIHDLQLTWGDQSSCWQRSGWLGLSLAFVCGIRTPERCTATVFTENKIHSYHLMRSPYSSTLKYDLFCNTEITCISSQYKTRSSYTSGVEYSGDLIRVPSLSRRQKSSSICTPGYGEAPDGRNKEEAPEWHNAYFQVQWIKHISVISAAHLRLPRVWQ